MIKPAGEDEREMFERRGRKHKYKAVRLEETDRELAGREGKRDSELEG